MREEDQLANRAKGRVDLRKVGLHLAEAQEKGLISGRDLRKELANQPVLGANALDGYLRSPYLIPEEWKVGKWVFFWGTIYRNGVGYLYVRYLYWDGDGWDWAYDWLGSDWDSRSPAAVVASSA